MIIDNEEIFFVEYERDHTKTIIYAPLRSYLALTSTENVKFLTGEDSDIKDNILRRIKDRHLIDMKELLNEVQNQTPDLSIPITDNCNLRCIYCHASAGEKHKTKSMSFNMIDAALAAYFKCLNANTEHIKIHFFGGGEPTFKLDKLKYAIELTDKLCQDKGMTCSYLMATNGCYGNDVRDLIVKKFKEVSLSFDGPAYIQNFHRPIANGSNSYDMVFETAKYFYERKFPFGVRATVSDYSLNYMHEIVDFFSSNFPNVRLSLEPLTPAGRALQHREIYVDFEEFGDTMVETFQYASNKPITLVNSAASEYDIIRPVFCSSVGVPHLTISIAGDVICCSRDHAPKEFTIGRFNEDREGIEIDQEKMEGIREFNIFNYKECEDCFAKYHCAGDCPDRRLSNNVNCNSIKKLGKYILNQKIDLAS
jgi:uncharacterized protein